MAVILDAFAGKMVEKLAELVEERVVTVLGVKDEVERLQQSMEMIKHVLQDAERKRIQSSAVEAWVRKLKGVVYDADDIIDLCRSEGGKLPDDQHSSRSVRRKLLSPISSYFSSSRFSHEIGDKIKNLNQRLDDINKYVPIFKLVQNEPDRQVTRVNPRQTTSLVDPSDIVGEVIKRATEDLVERIVNREGEQKCRVFAITGMGGVGKTTLAQNIFNHQKINSEFKEGQKKWVCISQKYSVPDLLKAIIRGAGGNTGDLQTEEELLSLLKNIISGKPFFLVLDDVWKADVWVGLLRLPLQIGAICSRILVTTRDQNVAKEMGTVHIHPVELLPSESGWELLCKSLYSSSQEEEMQRLRGIGIQIVEKCKGLPLAIKAIAGVLTKKGRSQGEWERVLRRDAWSMDKLPDDDLRGALYLSYEDLPSHLKQCFLFCSLFPEDYEFSRRDVVMYWVAEGFVETQKDSFLEIADEYFEDLVRRNLVQKAYTIFRDGDRYKMHDLLRSLAQFLSQDESFCGEAGKLPTGSTTTKLRRLTIADEEGLEANPELLLQQKSLRTLLFLTRCPSLGNDWFDSFPFLRLLMLRKSKMENIPDAVGKLIHLRLLDLHGTNISNLPESIRYLTNLEVLNLSGCKSLSTLPNGITRLCNLLFLDLYDTPLSFIPAGMGSLKQLNILKGFVLGEDSSGSAGMGCRLEDLKSLSQLNELSIDNLERAVVAKKGQMVLQDKPHLKKLKLNCSSWSTRHPTNEIEEVFAELFPPPCLEELEICGYFGREFPGWMMSASLGSSLPQLRSLSLGYCRHVSQLPPLGLLPELRHLRIESADAVVTIGPEFLGSSATSVAFPMLEYLYIGNMPNLEEWSFCGEEEGLAVLPHLQKLCIEGCPKLESLPRGLPYLTDQLYVNHCYSLERISDFPALKELRITVCGMLKSVEKVDALKRLELLDIDNERLSEWLLRFLQQRQQQMKEQQDDDFQLHLHIGDKPLKRCLMGCEYWPIIQNVPLVNAQSFHSDAYLKYTKKPFSYDTNL